MAWTALAARPVAAHHGKDFLRAETAELPHRGQFFFFSSHDFLRHEGETEFEASPALLLGLSRHVALEVHGHLVREGGEWRYESTAPAVRVLLPGSGSLRFGVGFEYEIAAEEGGHDHVEGRLIASHRRGDRVLVLNFLATRARGEDEETGLGYAVGLRPAVGRRLSWGLEAEGSLRGDSRHELLLGVYAEPSDRVTIKLGVGKGFGEASPDWTFRSGLVVRF
jgi:hypothetical protein